MSPSEPRDPLRTLVIVPTYDEVRILAASVGRVRAARPDADLLVVDDGSPDGTGDLADRLSAADPHVHVLHRERKEGLGAAYLAGFAWALARRYDVVVQLDADGSHQPEQLGRLLDAVETADVVIGSRWVAGGTVDGWARHREVLSRTANWYVRHALGLPVRDATGGYRAYRTTALREVDLHRVQSQGYCFQIDLTRRAVQAGLRVTEVPIDFVERLDGQSKMSGGIVREALVRVTGWALADRFGAPDASDASEAPGTSPRATPAATGARP